MGTEYDQLIVNGTAVFETGAWIEIEFIDLDPEDEVDEVFRPLNGDFLSFVNLPNGVSFDFPTFTVVPIPPALWLFGSALFGLMHASRRARAA